MELSEYYQNISDTQLLYLVYFNLYKIFSDNILTKVLPCLMMFLTKRKRNSTYKSNEEMNWFSIRVHSSFDRNSYQGR